MKIEVKNNEILVLGSPRIKEDFMKLEEILNNKKDSYIVELSFDSIAIPSYVIFLLINFQKENKNLKVNVYDKKLYNLIISLKLERKLKISLKNRK